MIALLCALATSFILSAVAIPLLRRAQFMDIPNDRSSHTSPIPRGGGVAVVLALLLVGVVLSDMSWALAALLVSTATLALVGLIDDLRSLPASVRLIAQIVVAVGLSAALLRVGEASGWWFAVFVVAITGYVNAFNFMDGVNGITGLTSTVVGLHWAWVGMTTDHQLIHVLGLVLAGASIGFLPWNVPVAKVFLGDVGSYGVGLFVVGLSVLAISSGLPWHWALAPLVVYGADTGWVLVKRKTRGASLTEPHREHVYQRLVDSGWSHLASAGLCAGAGALVCVAALASGRVVTAWAVVLVVLVVALYLGTPLARRKPATV